MLTTLVNNSKLLLTLIQSGGGTRTEEATATPETEGADLSDT